MFFLKKLARIIRMEIKNAFEHLKFALSLCVDLPYKKMQFLLKHFSYFSQLQKTNVNSLVDLGLTPIQADSLKKIDEHMIEAHLDWLQQNNNHHVAIHGSKNYPKRLLEIASPPKLLFIEGDITLLQQPQIAIVGSRKPTHYGLDCAKRFSFELSKAGLTITSGLAMGIDSAAHLGALAAKGGTVAVIGTGINLNYPSKNRDIAAKLRDNGVIISEFPLSCPPLATNFPKRNRIISGLSLGTLVVEAMQKSGSLITAKFALEQNRDVFAIPGPIHSSTSCGTNHLLQQGAKLTQSVDDILQEYPELQPAERYPLDNLNNKLAQKHNKLLECIEITETELNRITHRSGLTIAELAPILLELETSGLIGRGNKGYYRAHP